MSLASLNASLRQGRIHAWILTPEAAREREEGGRAESLPTPLHPTHIIFFWNHFSDLDFEVSLSQRFRDRRNQKIIITHRTGGEDC